MNDADQTDAWFTPWRLAGLIALLIAVAYPGVVMGTHSLFYRDFGLFTYPLAWYHHASFWRGEIPLWNPLNDCGLPFLAQWNTAVLYPFSFIYVIFPLPWSLNYFCLLHLILAGVGMYFLAFRWLNNRLAASLAGLVFAWNGLSVQSLMWASTLAALAWMPLVVLFVERALQEGGRRLVPAALVGAIQMLTGSPEVIVLTWLIIGMLALAHGWRKTIGWPTGLRRLMLMILLVAGLTAAQTLPFLEFIAHSNRNSAFANNQWALPSWGWANLLVPLFHCSSSILGVFSQDEQQWTASYYLGIGTVGLAVWALWRGKQPRVWLLGGMAIAGVLLAMGEANPIYALAKRLFPSLGMMRYPIKIIVLTVFAVPLLAATGLARYQRLESTEMNRARRQLLVVGLVLMTLVAGILFAAYHWPHERESWSTTWHSGASRAAFLALMWAAILRMSGARLPRERAVMGWAILLLAGLDGLTHTPKENPTVTVHAYDPAGIRETVVARPGESRAMVSPVRQAFLSQAATTNALNYFIGCRRSLFMDCNLPEGIPVVGGFYPIYLKREAAVRERLYKLTNSFPEPLADFIGVSQISAPDNLFDWIPRTNFMPLMTAGQKPVFAPDDKTLRVLGSESFSPRTEVYLPADAAGALQVTNGCAAQVNLRKFSAHKLMADVDAPQRAMVVVAQSYYYPWRAYVDDQPVPLWRANYAFQALEVPAGHHVVKLTYQDKVFWIGAAISLFTLLGCLAAMVRWRGSAPSRSPASRSAG